MKQAAATYQDGKVVFDAEVDWPDGIRVKVLPAVEQSLCPAGVRQSFLDAMNDEESFGLDDSLWPQTPEEREIWLQWFDNARESCDLSTSEIERMERDRQERREEQRELTKKNWEELDKLFQ